MKMKIEVVIDMDKKDKASLIQLLAENCESFTMSAVKDKVKSRYRVPRTIKASSQATLQMTKNWSKKVLTKQEKTAAEIIHKNLGSVPFARHKGKELLIMDGIPPGSASPVISSLVKKGVLNVIPLTADAT